MTEEAGNSLRGEANSQGIFTWTEEAGNISGKSEREEILRAKKHFWKEREGGDINIEKGKSQEIFLEREREGGKYLCREREV